MAGVLIADGSSRSYKAQTIQAADNVRNSNIDLYTIGNNNNTNKNNNNSNNSNNNINNKYSINEYD